MRWTGCDAGLRREAAPLRDEAVAGLTRLGATPALGWLGAAPISPSTG